ncbi:hypothetical protein J2S74_000826 [Evansella vedderi]|uniref:Bacterial Ig-like domain-containing protein n=1 Tax=Evansella vedderi TaxID=38282 RepID=A0ABT9ZQE4_9BACI|nr:immunoglobulin-like domain-containing protein [Evansella vedderi]MDQ0253454.1 hypothetical protein [Evansella vedderi]
MPSSIKGKEVPDKEVAKVLSELMLSPYNEELWEKTKYDGPTGKWFLHDGSGHFGYGLTSGTMKPGGDLFVSLYAQGSKEVTMERDIRIQLTELEEDWSTEKDVILEELVHVERVAGEETVYSGTLPKKENALYLLSVEILDEAGEVEDTRVTLIYVPIPEINASLSTDQEVYERGTAQLTLTLENHGPTNLFFGVYYSIEKKVGGTWRVVPMDIAFVDIGITLAVGDEYEETIDIRELTEGEYRVIKDIQTDGLDLRETLAAAFTIE